MKKTIAFTIAEILIVLGIIGIIAEMTIPPLVNSTEKIEFTSKYKKTYASLNESMQGIKQDHGGAFDPQSWYLETYGGDGMHDQNMENDFKKYLKISKECLSNGMGDGDCFSIKPYQYLNKKASFIMSSDDWPYSVVLSDGTAIRFFPPYECSFEEETCQIYMYVDLNGPKKPNIYGKDLHTLYVLQDGKVVPDLFDASVSIQNQFCNEKDPQGWGISCGIKMLNGTY